MADEPAESVSQQLTGVVDVGAESFSVDTTPVPVEGKTGEIPTEEKPEETPTEKSEEIPTEKPAGEAPAGEEDIPAGVKKRLATMTRKRRDAERTTATLQTQNQELLTRIEALERPGEESGEAPQVDDFDTEEEYLEAVTDFKADQKIAEREAVAQTKRQAEAREGQEAEAQERQDVLVGKLQKGVEKFNDFEDVIEDLNITGDMINILESLPNVPEVVYALGNDPETVAKLIEMPYLNAAYMMKEISNGLSIKKKTKAPDPINPVTTTGGVIKGLEQMNMAEYTSYRNKQDAEKRGRV